MWALLNDPAVLKACIPGCQSLEKTGDNGFAAVVKAKIGPVAATFKGKVELSDIVPEVSYRIAGEGEGGVAGFAKGAAKVSLADAEGGTLLRYDVEAHVGGKMAQLGSRLIDGVAKGMADKFFASFAEAAGGQAAPAAPAAEPRRSRAVRRRSASHPEEDVMAQEDLGMVHVSMAVNGRQVSAEVDPQDPARAVPARESAPDRHACRLRHLAVRRLRRPCRRRGDQVLHGAGGDLRRRDVTTIEGLAHDGKLHPMQQAFQDNHGLQCGFCTPGMIMAAIDLVNREGPNLDEAAIRHGLEGNICRCTGYHNIVKAVAQGAREMAAATTRQRRRITAATSKPFPEGESIMSATGIGASVKRKEDIRFITGKGHYVDDINRPGQAYAYFLRSPHAHATIDRIDTSEALKAPGVVAIFTGDDIAADKVGGLICGWMIHSKDGSPMKAGAHPALAQGKVRYVGDHVAVVIADTYAQARDAAEKIEVDYAELPAVVDLASAAKPGPAATP